jgi:hypothetical protein
MLAFLVAIVFFTTWGAKMLPMQETVSLFGRLEGSVITFIPLWVLCPKNQRPESLPKWSTTEAGAMGLLASSIKPPSYIPLFISATFFELPDPNCFLKNVSAGEVQDASLNVPRAM